MDMDMDRLGLGWWFFHIKHQPSMPVTYTIPINPMPPMELRVVTNKDNSQASPTQHLLVFGVFSRFDSVRNFSSSGWWEFFYFRRFAVFLMLTPEASSHPINNWDPIIIIVIPIDWIMIMIGMLNHLQNVKHWGCHYYSQEVIFYP